MHGTPSCTSAEEYGILVIMFPVPQPTKAELALNLMSADDEDLRKRYREFKTAASRYWQYAWYR